MRILLGLFVCLFSSQYCFGQSTEIDMDMSSAKLYKKGKIAMTEGDYFLANSYFEVLKQKGFESNDQKFSYVELKIKLHHYQDALENIDQLEKEKYQEPLLNYYKATMLFATYKPHEAKDYISFFLKNKSNREMYKAQSSHLIMLKSFVDTINTGVDTALYAHVFEIKKNINHPGAEFSPTMYQDGLLYGSQDMQQVLYFNSNQHTKKDVPSTRKLYFAKGSRIDFEEPTPFPLTFEKKEISSFCFDLNHRIIYLSACQYDEKLKKYICNIYQSKFKDSVWANPELIPELNIDNFTSTHVNMGFDAIRKVPILFFSSDRPLGRGGMDIWSSYFNTRTLKFSTPRNLGSKINTMNDEITPFYHLATNQLFFSSNGRGGYGGHDIYSSALIQGIFGQVNHLGQEVNSPQDDVFFSPDKTLEKGYLVSNRYSVNSLVNPHCCDDIFYFDQKELPVPKSTIHLDVISKNKMPIVNYDYKLSRIDTTQLVFLENGTGKMSSEIKELARHSTYEMEVHAAGYFRKKIMVEVINDSIYFEKIILDSIDYNPIVLPLVEFDFDSFSLTHEARLIIDSLVLPVLTKNPTLRVELGAHTDCRGDDLYNEQLSWKRANAIRLYILTHHDIDPKRLEHKGYGEHVPVAPNEYEDGRDYPEGRQRNRRCEFRILPDEYDPY